MPLRIGSQAGSSGTAPQPASPGPPGLEATVSDDQHTTTAEADAAAGEPTGDQQAAVPEAAKPPPPPSLPHTIGVRLLRFVDAVWRPAILDRKSVV